MDDVLGNGVGRSSLGTKDAHQRHGRQVPCLDLVILMDEVEQVQLLALVLMQALYLNVKDRLRIDFLHRIFPAYMQQNVSYFPP